MSTQSLATLKKGQDARIVKILPGESHIRLMEMGMVVGVSLRVCAISPLGNPIAVQLGGHHLALRKSDAAQIIVEL